METGDRRFIFQYCFSLLVGWFSRAKQTRINRTCLNYLRLNYFAWPRGYNTLNNTAFFSHLSTKSTLEYCFTPVTTLYVLIQLLIPKCNHIHNPSNADIRLNLMFSTILSYGQYHWTIFNRSAICFDQFSMTLMTLHT